ncbi:MAG: hypothetical protein ACD_2C00185G0002 [uncultured bacterium (gcode 4)]|uniref:PPM-type phosphatase domain-containing protein n=1 Tax=uncultured bacterium (gcode 4) TaxID=1234023 RepID=K2G4W0_9BACT|nr:MAG: hypothetical protein ACD_2C00185G0002 [uncultured bacterium (gcode 4)]
MFGDFFNLFKNKTQETELINDFDKALYFIRTYEKAADYKTAIMATRELILKHKSWINYYEESLKRLYSLEASNIDAVSNDARDKIKKIKDWLDILYKRLGKLDSRLLELEKIKFKADEKLKLKVENEKIKFRAKEIKETLSRKDYTKALQQWKKFVFDFQWNKDALNLLQKIQRMHDKDKTSKEKEKAKKDRITKTLQEAGITNVSVEEKSKTWLFWENLKLEIKEMKRKWHERTDYIKRMKTLNSLEMLLAKTWSINNISNLDMENMEKDWVFSVIHSWTEKDIWDFDTYGFDFFGKIIGKDKIIWDTFGHYKTMTNKVIFYFWDATGHWVQAGFTVAILSKIFFEFTKNYKQLQDLVFQSNNSLKEKIKWKSFITWIFFEWDYAKGSLKMVWAWHPPLYVYRRKEWTSEKIIPGWLALWVRNIPNLASMKIKDIPLENGDVIFGYTDWIVETKNAEWVMYLLDRVEKSFTKHAKLFLSPKKIYEWVLADVNNFKWGLEFDDDVSFFIFTRNTNKDLIANKEELEQILKETNSKKSLKEIQIKKRTKEEIIEELKQEKHERELKVRLERLDRLAKIWEYHKLKQEVLMYYREGFIHDKMKFYLEKAIANEQKVMIMKMEEKLDRKYKTLIELYKKWEYEIVVKEAMDVIFKNWKI